MLGHRSSWRVLASTVAACLLVAGLCGGSCTVVYCDEDCDPCVQQCQCSGRCRNGLAFDYETVHRFSTYRRTATIVPEGVATQTFTDIVGLSLDLAHGPVEHSAADYTRFAEAVIDVNSALLAPRGVTWTPEPVQLFQTAFVVPFHGDREGQQLEFLFDRRGNLVEIHQAF
ncbi:MAG: hypothetical protein ACKVXR_02865 [Planctomycetota bacterium]